MKEILHTTVVSYLRNARALHIPALWMTFYSSTKQIKYSGLMIRRSRLVMLTVIAQNGDTDPQMIAPKGSGSYLRPKTHIQHTYLQHLSTSTQTSTNHKSTHCNRMG